MLFIIAGVPAAHYSTFQKHAARIVGTGHSYVASPLRSDPAGKYLLGPGHADRLLEELEKRLESSPNELDKGMGLLYLCSQWDDPASFAKRFYPFCATHPVKMPVPISRSGVPGQITAKKIVRNLTEAGPSLIRAVAAMGTELRDRLKRTPILLPIRNFSSSRLGESVDRLFFCLSGEKRPPEAIKQACEEFEKHHPFARVREIRKRCFVNNAHVQFRAPGRGMHGRPHLGAEGHNIRCYLSGRLRLGAPFLDTFHYDCMRARGALSGRFSNCHDTFGNYTGRPHLNIAPSDFIRGK